MIDDPDIFRAARLIIDQHGEEAATYAAGRADLLLEDGDPEGSAVWHRILAAIKELQRGPRKGEAPNWGRVQPLRMPSERLMIFRLSAMHCSASALRSSVEDISIRLCSISCMLVAINTWASYEGFIVSPQVEWAPVEHSTQPRAARLQSTNPGIVWALSMRPSMSCSGDRGRARR